MFEELNQHRAAVAENIQKACEIGFTGNELEKAHKVGDVHPNGKWVWTQLPSGRYDWRVIKKTSAGSGGSAPATAQKQDNKSWDKLSDFYKNGSDERKMWMEWDRFQKTGDHNRISSIRKILEKKFPNVSSWKHFAPNMNSSKLVAVGADGKEIASIDFGGKGVDLPKLQTFMDKCSAVKKTAKKEIKVSVLDNVPGLSNLRKYLTIFNSKYTDLDKVELSKTPKGNWDVRYDGHRLGILNGDQIPESTVKKMGFNVSLEEKEKKRKESIEAEKKKREKLVAELDAEAKKKKNTLKGIGDVQDFLKTEGISSKHLTQITTRFHNVDLSQKGDKIFGSGTISLFFDVNADENGVSVRVKNNDDSHPALQKLNKELRDEFLGGTAFNDNYFYLNSNDDLKKFVEIYKKIKKKD